MKLPSFLLLLLSFVTVATAQESDGGASVQLKIIATGFDTPIEVASPSSEPSKLYVAERGGRIRTLDTSGRLLRDLLDLEDILDPDENSVLQSIAFSPDFATSRAVYVAYVDKQGDTIIGRLATSESETVDEDALLVVLKIVQPTPHKSTSSIAFGTDGYLYIALGAVPDQAQPQKAQPQRSLFGKVLRIDLANPQRFSIPSDNPFIKASETPAETWALGVRYPIRLSFDRKTGKLVLMDTGTNAQEIKIIEKGHDYGGDACSSERCDRRRFSPPVYTHRTSPEAMGIGGFPYNGALFPFLRGSYMFSDSISKRLYRIPLDGPANLHELVASKIAVSAIGEGGDGEVYVALSDGSIATLVPTR